MKIDKVFPYFQYKGSSTFKFTFTIDFDFYDKGVGGKGSKAGFWFVLNCRTGQIVEFENISEHEKPYIRIPYHGKVESPWSIESYKGESFSLNMHGSDRQYCSPDTEAVRNIEKVINATNLRAIVDAVLFKIRGYRGPSFIGEDLTEENYWQDPARQAQIQLLQIFREDWEDCTLSPEDITEFVDYNEEEEVKYLPYIENGSFFECLPNLSSFSIETTLNYLPKQILAAKNLVWFSIRGDDLRLPENLGELSSLSCVYLNGKIELPETIGGWKNIKELFFDNWKGDVFLLPDSLASLRGTVNLFDIPEESECLTELSHLLQELVAEPDADNQEQIKVDTETIDTLAAQLLQKEWFFDWLSSEYDLELELSMETITSFLQSQFESRRDLGTILSRLPYSYLEDE